MNVPQCMAEEGKPVHTWQIGMNLSILLDQANCMLGMNLSILLDQANCMLGSWLSCLRAAYPKEHDALDFGEVYQVWISRI